MTSKVFVTAFAIMLMSSLMPVKADVIADQSRISISSPLSPNLDLVLFPQMQVYLIN